MSATTAFELDRSSPVPLYRQIEHQFRIAIHEGRLRPGARLPGIRTLAHDLGIARVTVATAYEQLVAEGYLESRVGSGTRVAADSPDSRPLVALPAAPLKLARSRRRLDLRPGAAPVDGVPGGFPAAAWEDRLRAAWRDVSTAMTPAPTGAADLRAALSLYLDATRGTRTEPGRIVVGGGPRVLVAALVSALDRENRSDRIPVLGLLSPADPEVRRLARRSGAVTLDIPLERAALHAAAGVLLVEDDRSALLRLAGPPPPALQGSLAIGRLALLGDLDPLVVPGVSLGWLALPGSLAEAVATAVADLDGAPSAVEQHALAGWIADGGLDRRARRLRHALIGRRTALEGALRAELGEVATLERAGGRPLVTIQLVPRDIIRAGIVGAARAAGVTIASPDADGRLPIGFASLPEDALVDAARRLGRAIDALDPGARRRPRSPDPVQGSSIVRRLFPRQLTDRDEPRGPGSESRCLRPSRLDSLGQALVGRRGPAARP
ncbi:MAG: PLP-dependent aminotransferase family protein [Chloroflexota bacterium]